jgi:ParB family chromosome partitioning protein
MLGFEEFAPILLPLLDGKNDGIRKAAASAMARCARPGQIEALKPALQHDDPQVRYRIALGLAFCREPIALPVVFSSKAAKVLDDKDRLMAAVAYGALTESHLAAMLDSQEAWIRNAAFIVLVMRDWRDHDGSPARVLAALSAEDPRIRLAAARALEAFTDVDAFGAFLAEFVNDRGEEKAWEIPAGQIASVAGLIVFGRPSCQAQMLTVLETLAEEKQDAWDFTLQVYAIRYAQELDAATKAARKQRRPKLRGSADELSQLAFGTYVGLVREQGVIRSLVICLAKAARASSSDWQATN